MQAEQLLDEAEVLFEKAEEQSETNLNAGLEYFRQGIGNLCRAFLTVNSQEPLGDLRALYFQCRKLEPEFETIDEVMDYFIDPGSGVDDPEIFNDAANEIWDFIVSLLLEEDDDLGDEGDLGDE